MTQSGRMGRVPPGTSKGDKVCYMQGISVPCILRSHPEHLGKYIFIGQCYINGMMCGEAFWEGVEDVQELQLV